MQRLHLILKPLFWAALIFAFAAAVMPSESAPSLSHSDKINHMIAFLTLSLLAALAWPRARWWRIAAWLGLFGAVIEFTQMIPILQRDASFLDWVADLGALLLGLFVARSVQAIRLR